MKFLTAALFVCLALVGQIQGGSLRGLSAIVPHQQYGVPLLSSEVQTEEIKPEIDVKQPAINTELAKQEEPTTSKPFIDHLPLIDSVVNFGYPSGKPSANPIEPVTKIPELSVFPSLGLPSLPSAPIVPVKIEQLHLTQDLSNSYLPPKIELPLLQPGLPNIPAASIVPLTIGQPIKLGQSTQSSAEYTNGLLSSIPHGGISFKPADVIFGTISDLINKPQKLSNAYLPPKPELPLLQPGLPNLPAVPIVPLNIGQPIESNAELSNAILPPRPQNLFPQIGAFLPKPITDQINMGFDIINSFVPKPQQLSNAYLPPKPELPLLQPGLPSLPEAPKVPLTIAIEQPIEAQVELSNTYLPPKPELPLLQPGLPSLPEAPKVPLTIAIEQPIEAQAELSNTYLPPKPELPLLQPGLPSLPEAPKIPLTIAIEQPIEAQIELSNTYLPPKPELPLLQPGLPSLPEAPKVPLTIAIEQPIEAQAELSNTYLPPKPELPLLQPGFPSLPEAPIVVSKPEPIDQIELPKVTEIPALPEAPVIPASAQIIEESTTGGYTYKKPVPAFIETEQLSLASQAPVVDDIKQDQIAQQAPIFAHQPLSPVHIAPGYISSHFIDISQANHIQPAQQILVQHSLPVQHSHQQILVQPTLQEQQVNLPSLFPAQQVLLQPSFPAQQVLAQPSIPILSEVNKAPVEAAASHHGYTYNAPKIGFPFPHQD